ncbi:hypothetical protein DICPUDRAFT_89866 [Dictyostelium purpureum]|uniref:Endoplasmic reticulum transmembrane protein n=1 Tax=Dictyostelium purpureum TaxID=5786 RepID=F0ZYQ2_DICPU|nr:uncharacterized protein DICPUDRAFT_89866 [Dictyostelium purpureum]EGC30917.1 hypothetical protein DICPUDRAFT_89866 [Dictyostelium purpureum]|eukprot:XP_003292546.1 hypothetical protein DICPUDRAFT_89866 [Dictyostelium purpureum]
MLPISMQKRKSIYEKIKPLINGPNTRIVLRVVALLLLIVFVDSIVNSYNINKKLHSPEFASKIDRQNEYTRMFRYQRNIYISGFSLFLYFLIFRSQSIVADLSKMEVNQDAIAKQTKNNQSQVETLISENEKLSKQLKDLKKMEKEHQAMKSQAENTSKEYMKLKEEYNDLLGKKTKDQKKKD